MKSDLYFEGKFENNMPIGKGKWVNFSGNVTQCLYKHEEIGEDDEEEEENKDEIIYDDAFFDKIENEKPKPPKQNEDDNEEE